MLLGHGVGGDGYFRVLGNMEFNHAADVHAVDVIGAEDGHHMRVGLLDKVDVLRNGVGRTLVPRFVLRTHLGRHGNDKVALQQATELPHLA